MRLGRIKPARKTGREPFLITGHPAVTVGDFWEWSTSDMVGNTERGALAEYIVGLAIGDESIEHGVRQDWAAYDLSADDIKVEVKSAAYIQSWPQPDYSVISFNYRKTRKWDAETNHQDDLPTRAATVYVFALLAHKDQATLNPLDVSQWQFYVVPTVVLDGRKRSQYSITLPSLEKFCAPCAFDDLKQRLVQAHGFVPPDGMLDKLDKLGCDWSEWASAIK